MRDSTGDKEVKTIQTQRYDPAAAGIVTEQVPVAELAQHPDSFVATERYDAASAGIVTERVRVSTLLKCALMLALIAFCLPAAEIEIISSTPMGFPCSQNVQPPFPCIESQNGWLVMAKGSAKLYKATLRYRDGNEEKTLTVIDGPGPSGITSFAFRPGRWLPQSDFVDVTVTELHEGASAKQDRNGAVVITPAGPPVFGPPIAESGKTFSRCVSIFPNGLVGS
jgi:hypothetical protein